MQEWPPSEVQRARATLVRAVAKCCPARMSDRRDDIVQEALMRVLKFSDGKGSALPGASYLWKAAYTATIDEIRRQKRRREEPLQSAAAIDTQPGGTLPIQPAGNPEMKRTLQREIAKLNSSRRMAVLLQLYGFSLAESAQILGWPEKRVENHRYLGMSDLRRALKAEGFER